jgi:hypothetical protein
MMVTAVWCISSATHGQFDGFSCGGAAAINQIAPKDVIRTLIQNFGEALLTARVSAGAQVLEKMTDLLLIPSVHWRYVCLLDKRPDVIIQ